MEKEKSYPINLTMDYQDYSRNKVSVFFRVFMAVPIMLILILLIGVKGKPAGLVVLPVLFMLLFRQKYPKWWFDWNLTLSKLMYRVMAYVCLLTDEYPSTDEEQSVHITLPYPNAKEDLNRWLPLVKWFLAIPHYFVLAIMGTALLVIVVLSWFVILITGRLPRDFYNFIVGVFRWSLRVSAYAFMLTTDQYPPFSLNE